MTAGDELADQRLALTAPPVGGQAHPAEPDLGRARDRGDRVGPGQVLGRGRLDRDARPVADDPAGVEKLVLPGTSVGTAVVGTLIALLVTTQLPAGTWSDTLVTSFFQGERVIYAALAVVVGVVVAWGALSLTDSRSVDEHPSEPADAAITS